jgi:multidrug efflux pump subunit AcrA (membrane-fusion protein)
MTRQGINGSRLFLILFLVYFVVNGCGDQAETGTDKKPEPRNVKKVAVRPVKALPPKGTVEYVGTLQAFLKVNVSSETGGTIEKLYFEKGNRVAKGELLATVSTTSYRLEVQRAEASVAAARSHLKKMEKGSRPEEIRVAEAVVQEAEAALFEAEKNFKRVEDLHEIHAVSNREYDSAKRAVDTALARVESAKQQFSLARQGPRIEDKEAARAQLKQAEAALAVAKDRLRKSRLHAPTDGIIAFRKVEEGEVIPPGTTITKIINLDRMKINLSLSEKDVHILEKANRFQFTVDAISGEHFSCRLFFLSPTAEPVTRSFPVELMIEEPDKRMADGMTVRVRFPLVDEKKTIKVPSAWLAEESGQIGLFTVRDGEAVFKQVKLGAYYDQRVEILSGLNDEELVITNPAGLKNGDMVEY